MAMNLKKQCPHCHSPIGQICTSSCMVNGGKIEKLRIALYELGLSLNDVVPEVDCSCCNGTGKVRIFPKIKLKKSTNFS